MASQTELRRQMTDQIIEALEKNVLPWRRPWRTSPNVGRPANVLSKQSYQGINPLLLELHAQRHGFSSRWYATFDQWKAKGCAVQRRPDHVEPGNWGATIVFYKPVRKTVVNQTTGEEDDASFLIMRTYKVFCADQVSGPLADQLKVQDDTAAPFPDYKPAERLISLCGADIRNGGERAFYTRPTPEGSFPNHTAGDYIMVPQKHRFEPVGAYYETMFHELAHWSEVRTKWDSQAHGYAMNELVAEMASCYLSTELGIPQGDSLSNHAAYLSSWLTAMENDHSYIFRAATQASKITDYLLAFAGKSEVVAA